MGLGYKFLEHKAIKWIMILAQLKWNKHAGGCT